MLLGWRFIKVQVWRLFVRHYEIEVLIGFSPLTALPIKTLPNISNHLYNERQARKDLRQEKVGQEEYLNLF
jgi:hypothetical protein